MATIKISWKINNDRKIKLRLKFIGRLHNLFPRRLCWASCVGWAYGIGWNILPLFCGKDCKEESKVHSTNMCYCGGWYNGKHYKATDKSHPLAGTPASSSTDDLPF